VNNDCQQVRYDESQWTLGKSQRSLDDPQDRFEESQRSLDDPHRELEKSQGSLEKSRRDNDDPQSEDEGLGTPGATMGFKVYVVLTTSNEKGSNTVTITNV
jgi:hypothetical protein